MEDKVRRAEAESRELELKRMQAEEEKKKMEQQTSEQAKDNLLMVSLVHYIKSQVCYFFVPVTGHEGQGNGGEGTADGLGSRSQG